MSTKRNPVIDKSYCELLFRESNASEKEPRVANALGQICDYCLLLHWYVTGIPTNTVSPWKVLPEPQARKFR
jgi:hypothetical protein